MRFNYNIKCKNKDKKTLTFYKNINKMIILKTKLTNHINNIAF